jgi:hypothetical protein
MLSNSTTSSGRGRIARATESTNNTAPPSLRRIPSVCINYPRARPARGEPRVYLRLNSKKTVKIGGKSG